MVIRNYHWLNLASRVLISTCSGPLVQTGERKQCSLFDFDHMTYDFDLQPHASQGQGRPSCQKSWSQVKQFKQESAHRQTDGHTLDATKHIINAATWSIIKPLEDYISFSVTQIQSYCHENYFLSVSAHHLNLVECLREDFDVVDERQLLGGVEGSPDLQVDWSVGDEERREIEQFSITLEFVRQHDR